MKKQGISIVFDFRKQAPSANDIGTVSIRINTDTRRTFLSTGVRCRRCEWSDKRWVVGRPDAPALNERIKAAYDEALSSGGEAQAIDTSAPFLEWFGREIDHQFLKPDTMHRHRQLLRELEAYGKIKTFSDVNPRKIGNFLVHISRRTTVKAVDGRLVRQPIRQTAIYTYYRRLAKWVHLAQAQGLVAYNALAGVSVPRGQYTQREHLTRDELDRWQAAAPPYPHLIRARDLFAIQCGTGLAYIDLMQTDFSRIEPHGDLYTLTGTRQKTGQSFFIVILPFAKEIIDRYGGQLPKISNQKYNDHLKMVAAYAGINKRITSHVGRHTYACLCLAAGVRIEAVQRTLGHSDIKTTQIYARLVDNDVLAAFTAASYSL